MLILLKLTSLPETNFKGGKENMVYETPDFEIEFFIGDIVTESNPEPEDDGTTILPW